MTGSGRAWRWDNNGHVVGSFALSLMMSGLCTKSGMKVHARVLIHLAPDATKANREMASDTITRFMDKEGWFTADSAQAEYSMVVDISGLKVKPGVEGFERSVRAVWEPAGQRARTCL